MSRIAAIDSHAIPANDGRRAVLDQIHAAFGAVPAMFRTVANSEAALKQMWSAFVALGGGQIDAKLGEQIAVAVANRNRCGYCLAAHTALGRKAGASGAEMSAAQLGISDDPKTAAALRFALAVVEQRGAIDASEVGALRDVGFRDAEIVEILGQVALNLFTNYVNLALDVPLDFPQVQFRQAA